MTWHLKDRELEKKLEEFTGGEFVNSLNREIERDNIDSEFFVWVAFSRKLSGDENKENCLLFRTDELEEVPEYKPKIWNDSRKVMPPEEVVFRAKIHRVFCRETPYVDYECLTYKDGRWYKVRDGKVRPVRIDFNPGDYVDFKAWED